MKILTADKLNFYKYRNYSVTEIQKKSYVVINNIFKTGAMCIKFKVIQGYIVLTYSIQLN